MNSTDLASRAIDILSSCPYINIATANGSQPWNTPVYAIYDDQLNIYWSSWYKSVHSLNIAANPKIFITIYNSTRARGTNNLRCLYLKANAVVVDDNTEIHKACSLLYVDEPFSVTDFINPSQKRIYKAIADSAWLNSLSERELAPTTVKMRTEVSLEQIKEKL